MVCNTKSKNYIDMLLSSTKLLLLLCMIDTNLKGNFVHTSCLFKSSKCFYTLSKKPPLSDL